MYLDLAAKVLPAERWADYLDLGTELFVAHNLTLDGQRAKPLSGLVTGKTVGSASVSYDGASVTLNGAGPWNATGYGARFWQLAYMIGAGGVQV